MAKKNKQPAKRKFVDWDSIEPLYRAGSMSLNDICNQYAADHKNSTVWKTEVTNSTIWHKAKNKKWVKNLADRVKERVQEKLTVGLTVSDGQSDEDAVEAAAKEPVEVALGQRARTHLQLKIQDELSIELRENIEKLDIMARVRGFKDIAASIKTHHSDQSDQYKLTDKTEADKNKSYEVCFGDGGNND